jgi:hypothetical protein
MARYSAEEKHKVETDAGDLQPSYQRNARV